MTAFMKRLRTLLMVLGLGGGLISSFAAVGPSMAAELPVSPVPLEIVTTKARHAFHIEIASNDATRAEGLMFRTSLAPDAGMLFDFKREQPVYFWMKNTYVSLDMIFVRTDGSIINIAADTTPLSEAIVPSGSPVRFVFEVPAGTARRLGIGVGDRLVHPAVPTH